MHLQGEENIGYDDQENKMNYYNHNMDRVVLDHKQRIFTVFFGVARDRYKVGENCTVIDSHTGQQVCIAHANGGTKWEILYPLLHELEAQGCRKKRTSRAVNTYGGL